MERSYSPLRSIESRRVVEPNVTTWGKNVQYATWDLGRLDDQSLRVIVVRKNVEKQGDTPFPSSSEDVVDVA